MKVRINQAINIDEIPDKLKEIAFDIQRDYEKIQSKLDDCMSVSGLSDNSSMKYNLMVELINSLRMDLGMVDGVLSDLNSILEAYVKILDPPVPAPATDTGLSQKQEVNNADKG